MKIAKNWKSKFSILLLTLTFASPLFASEPSSSIQGTPTRMPTPVPTPAEIANFKCNRTDLPLINLFKRKKLVDLSFNRYQVMKTPNIAVITSEKSDFPTIMDFGSHVYYRPWYTIYLKTKDSKDFFATWIQKEEPKAVYSNSDIEELKENALFWGEGNAYKELKGITNVEYDTDISGSNHKIVSVPVNCKTEN